MHHLLYDKRSISCAMTTYVTQKSGLKQQNIWDKTEKDRLRICDIADGVISPLLLPIIIKILCCHRKKNNKT